MPRDPARYPDDDRIRLTHMLEWAQKAARFCAGRDREDLDRDEMLRFLEAKVAKWWLPEDVVFVNELPHTATGNLLKTKLREDFSGYKFGPANAAE